MNVLHTQDLTNTSTVHKRYIKWFPEFQQLSYFFFPQGMLKKLYIVMLQSGVWLSTERKYFQDKKDAE